MIEHRYCISLKWTGNQGKGTQSYDGYSRDHEISTDPQAPVIYGSSDPSFRGNPQRYNPEQLFLSSLASCHMLWYLHLCSNHGIVVTVYEDRPEGKMLEHANGSGAFSKVTLHPRVMITDPDKTSLARSLHQMAREKCFIANSCNFEIEHRPLITVSKEVP